MEHWKGLIAFQLHGEIKERNIHKYRFCFRPLDVIIILLVETKLSNDY